MTGSQTIDNRFFAPTPRGRSEGESYVAEEKHSPLSYVEVPEQKRLNDAREKSIPRKKWGPYLSERQWGTVREDYSDNGNAWDYFSHHQSPAPTAPAVMTVDSSRPRRCEGIETERAYQ